MKLVPRKNSLDLNLFSDNFFGDMFNDPFFRHNNTLNFMKTDVQEDGGNYIVDIDLPGYDKQDIKIELEKGYLTVLAQKNEMKEDIYDEGNYIHKERYTGKCSRSFYIGETVTEKDVKASYKNGILKLILPKEESNKIDNTKYISIE